MLNSHEGKAHPRCENLLHSGNDFLFKEQIENALRGPLTVLGGTDAARYAGIELSDNPDFGDYFSTVALRLGRTSTSDPRQIAEVLTHALSPLPQVAKAEASGEGFVNIFVRPAAAAQALFALGNWLNHFPGTEVGTTASALLRNGHVLDHKRSFVLKTLELLNAYLEEFDSSSAPCPEPSRLALLTEPEEFRVALQLHEFPSQLRTGVTCGYLYRLSILIHDGLFENGLLPEYWLCDWEEPQRILPRLYLLKLCLRVLALGTTSYAKPETNPKRR